MRLNPTPNPLPSERRRGLKGESRHYYLYHRVRRVIMRAQRFWTFTTQERQSPPREGRNFRVQKHSNRLFSAHSFFLGVLGGRKTVAPLRWLKRLNP